MDPTVLLPSASIDEATGNFLKKIQEVNPKVQTELVEKAFRFAFKAHQNQLRKSGEPFLAHPIAVALILAEQRLDPVTIAAGLLHDVIEDTQIPLSDIIKEFGEEVGILVDGVTKIKSFRMKSNQSARPRHTARCFSMAKDLRVIIIKFADRLHNLRP